MVDKNTDYFFAAVIGTFIGCLHGLVLWATMNTGALINEGGLGGTGSLDTSTASFIPASYLFYSNSYTLPLQVAAVIDTIAIITVLTSGIWLPKSMYIMEKLAEELKEDGTEEKNNREDGDE